jgi:hypothetical protein
MIPQPRQILTTGVSVLTTDGRSSDQGDQMNDELLWLYTADRQERIDQPRGCCDVSCQSIDNATKYCYTLNTLIY